MQGSSLEGVGVRTITNHGISERESREGGGERRGVENGERGGWGRREREVGDVCGEERDGWEVEV